jgi:ketosteroid isomerase-like protein
MTDLTIDEVETLFSALTHAQFEEFLSRCRDDLVLIVRGSDPETTYVSKSDIPDWYLSMNALAGEDIVTTIEVVRTVGTKIIVLFRHDFGRKGARYAFEMVNVCSFIGTQLATWASYPLNLPAYAHALGVSRSANLQPA